MTALSQRDIALATCVSEMTISRRLKALHRSSSTLTEFDALRVLTIAELKTAGFTVAAAAELLTEASAEVLYLDIHPENRCWVVFVETEEASFHLAALSTKYLMIILDSYPLAKVLPLHQYVSAARTCLDSIKATKGRRIAA